jgi:hypothetical protein
MVVISCKLKDYKLIERLGCQIFCAWMEYGSLSDSHACSFATRVMRVLMLVAASMGTR